MVTWTKQLPTLHEQPWGQKILDSINEIKSWADSLGVILQAVVFQVPGDLTVTSGTQPQIFTRSGTISRITAAVNSAPTDGDLILDVEINGVSIFQPADRP